MFRESYISQKPPERPRRLFIDKGLELYTWYDGDLSGPFYGFQFLYRLLDYPILSVTWTPAEGFLHHAIVDGEQGSAGWDMTASLTQISSELFDKERVISAILRSGPGLPREVERAVLGKLGAHPDSMRECRRCRDERAASMACADCGLRVCRNCQRQKDAVRYGACPARRERPAAEERLHSWIDLFHRGILTPLRRGD